MSYSGEIEAAGAAAIAAYVARTVSKAAMAGVQAVRSVRQTAAVHQMQSRMASLTAAASGLQAAMDQELQTASAQCYAEYEQTVAELSAVCTRSQDTSGYLRDCARARAGLYRSISEKRRALESETVAGIREALRSAATLLHRERQEIQASIQRVSDAQSRLSQAGTLTQEVIREAKAMAEDLRGTYGASQPGQTALTACTDLICRAEQLLEQGLWEAALTASYAAQDALLLRVGDLMVQECRTRDLLGDVRAALETACSYLAESSISYRLECTRTGVPQEKQITDFPRYFRGAWETLSAQLTALSQQLTSEHPCDYDPRQLEDLLEKLTDWQERFAAEEALAYERLHNELLRMETGRLLVGHYLAQGYQPVPLTAQERAVSSLDSLIVRLQKQTTGEQLELRLNAVPDADGHVSMRILLEDHTDYPGTFAEVEAARNAAREDTCGIIRASGVGQGLHLRQRCRNPGVPDHFQKG